MTRKPAEGQRRRETSDPLLDRDGAAQFLKVQPKTVSQALTRARAKDRDPERYGRRTLADFPEPDEYVAGRHGQWYRSTLQRYTDNRVGRGAPGRPRTRLPRRTSAE